MAWARRIGLSLVLAAASAWGGAAFVQSQNRATGQDAKAPDAKANEDRVFEMRTYVTHEGRLDALNARFRDHTTKLFEKHGMTNIGYWVPTDGERAKNTLVYLLAHESREAATASWKAFISDPDWKKAQAASEQDGPIVKEVKADFLNPTDYSEIK
jgi:hypothetical protein